MAMGANVVDGKLVYQSTETTSTGNTSINKDRKAGNNLDKDAFLNLLVAEMKYQDPMEPTSNTEYIAQFTTFSQLEQIQNMSNSMELQRASNMVGQYVLINSEDKVTGEMKSIMGKVEYVFYENNKAFLHVNGGDYSLDELDTIIDAEYYNASGLAGDFIKSMENLPSLENLTSDYADVIKNLRAVYNDMNSYQKSFIGNDYVISLQKYEERIAELTAKATE